MTKEELKKLIDQNEGHDLELKASTSLKQEIGQTISAFANTSGGVILIGMSPDGKIVGVDIGKKTLEDLANWIKDNTDPHIYPKILTYKVNDKNIIEITVKESDEKPVFSMGHAYQRVGRTSPSISVSKIRELARQEKKTLTWDAKICDGSSLKDIDQKKVDWFLERRESYRNVNKPADMSIEELLVNIGAISGEVRNPTNAGILFFGIEPQRFFINSQLRIARFKGSDVTHPVIDRMDCRGTLWEMLEQTEEFIRRNIRLLSYRVSTSFQREDKFEYPIDALREAMINALIHRNYTETADVRVFIFDNRIEVINPGSFPEGVSPDEPIHKPVNPIISQLIYDAGFIEKYGSGIKMMKRLCREWGNKEPYYNLHPLETKVIFDSPIQETTYIDITEDITDISEKLNERQKKALFYATRRGHITRKEYMEMNKVSHKTAHMELSDMLEKEFLIREGKGRGVKYSIKR
jgi:ATP-dependent DNA helicase RecG